MTRIQLELQLAERPLREARAWYIGGGAAEAWLREIARWRTPHGDLQVLPIPRSSNDAATRGALVVPAAGGVRGVSAACQAYGVIGGRLYLPVDARLCPDVDEQELRVLLDPQYDYVWHPSAGLIALAAEDVLSVGQLISVGDESPHAWTAALPGAAFPRRLLSLAADQDLTVQQLLRHARDGIGDQSGSLDDLPPSDREAKPGAWNAITRQGERAAANLVKWLTSGAAAASGGANWLEHWSEWASRRLEQISAEMEAARNREITRLMDLLEKDPDLGLQFALPLAGDAHRGAAAPGGRLERHNVDFSLTNFGGGRAADAWRLSADYYAQLQRRYFELATREQRLGRCRRAAYIFAELLGDFPSAAAALVAGAHWREAAVLYKERLGQPLEAARCLERGGLWSEAIEIYDEQQQHEHAGDLLSRLEQHDEARRRYEAALDVHRAGGDVLSAARLLEEKLAAPRDALAELSHGWPHTGQASACLRRVFQLAGRLGEHAESLGWLRRLRDDPPSRPATYFDTLDTLADVASNYPETLLRRRAADTSRVLISRKLPEATPADARKLMTSLAKLAPGDRLLGRDCQRYTDGLRRPRIAETTPPRSSRREAKKVASLELDAGVRWSRFVTCGDAIYAAGHRGNQIVVARLGWDGKYLESKTACWTARSHDLSLLLCLAPNRAPHLLVHSVSKAPLPALRCFSNERRTADAAHAGGGPGITAATLAASRATADRTWVVKMLEQSLFLYCLSKQGENLGGLSLTPYVESLEALEVTIQLHAASKLVYVGLGNNLVLVDEPSSSEAIEFPDPITHLAGTPPHTTERVVATFERGAVLCWEGWRHVRIAEDIGGHPVAGFNRRGLLTVVSHQGGEIYRTANGKAERVATAPPLAEQPIAVLAPPHVKQMGLAFPGGRVDLYEIP